MLSMQHLNVRCALAVTAKVFYQRCRMTSISALLVVLELVQTQRFELNCLLFQPQHFQQPFNVGFTREQLRSEAMKAIQAEAGRKRKDSTGSAPAPADTDAPSRKRRRLSAE